MAFETLLSPDLQVLSGACPTPRRFSLTSVALLLFIYIMTSCYQKPKETKYMRKTVLFCAILALCLFLPSWVKAQGSLQQDPGIKDTVIVDRISRVNPGEKVKVDVWLWYDEQIDSLSLPLTFWDEQNHDVFCDSATFGKIVEGHNGFVTDNAAKKVLLWAKGLSESHIVPILREVLATIYFHTGSSWDPEISVSIDTTTFQGKTIYHFKFFQFGDSRIEWIPEFLGGTLEVTETAEPEEIRDFTLSQNYPNPFNAVTAIEFSLRYSGQVSLGVYNILGQKVKTLFENANLSTGTYSADWYGIDETGKMASSGIYFYRLSITDSNNKQIFSAVRRMVFLK